MAVAVKLGFGPFNAPVKLGASGVLVVFCDDGLKFGPATATAIAPASSLVARAAKAERFTGKSGSALELVVPEGLKVSRLVVIGAGNTKDLEQKDLLKLGGLAMGKLPMSTSEAAVFAELPGGAMGAAQAADLAADLAQGIVLRAYAFDRYKTKRKVDEKPPARRSVTVAVGDVAAARKAYAAREAISGGVLMARDLVNEPANVLYPEEFARRALVLKKAGVAVEVLDLKAMKKLGMNALLGVGQGSVRESRVVVMRWNGGKAGEAPVAFIGKGVCFDTGGISIKPAAAMEDMKGDMADAACDKMIDSKFADMKNTGGSRWGGAITAAQFIQRHVADKTPWAHLDIAGTAFDSRQTDINRSWASGWGVRLLDRLVADYYEK